MLSSHPGHTTQEKRKVPSKIGTYYIGIDPGKSGGLAAIDKEGKVYALKRMPSTSPEVYRWFRHFQDKDSYTLMEQVSGYIGNAHPGSRMFEFGRSYGGLEMALAVTQIACTLITPQQWMRGLKLRTRQKGEDKPAWKKYLQSEAKKRYPKLRPTLGTSDALLIAHYCRLLYTQ